jgi:hypothetical protein
VPYGTGSSGTGPFILTTKTAKIIPLGIAYYPPKVATVNPPQTTPQFYTLSDYTPVLIVGGTTSSSIKIYDVPAGYDLFLTSYQTSAISGAGAPGVFYTQVGGNTGNFLFYYTLPASSFRDFNQTFYIPVKIQGSSINLGVNAALGATCYVTFNGFLVRK